MTALSRSLAHNWGATAAERTLPFPCDRLLPIADVDCFRAVGVRAPAPILFRWLCQLRVAPYSYDWIDNAGHRSPRRLTPGLERLAPGQRVMTIFELVEFEPDRQLTLVMAERQAVATFGSVAVSYVILPQGSGCCRLVVKLLVRYRRRGPGRWLRPVFLWGDVIMMRKQLLTLKGLAEGDWRASVEPDPARPDGR